MIQSTYAEVRPLVQIGDIIAFGGHDGFISKAIKVFTRSPISHIGVVLEVKLTIEGESQPGRIVQLIESTTLNGRKGVQINRLSERVADYVGDVWWLPISDQMRAATNWVKFYDYLLKMETSKVGYDYHQVGAMVWQGNLAKIPFIRRIFTNPRNASKVYCSELVCAAFEHGGSIDIDINYSEVSPQCLAEMPIYRLATQIKTHDKPVEIPKFNSRFPK